MSRVYIPHNIQFSSVQAETSKTTIILTTRVSTSEMRRVRKLNENLNTSCLISLILLKYVTKKDLLAFEIPGTIFVSPKLL